MGALRVRRTVVAAAALVALAPIGAPAAPAAAPACGPIGALHASGATPVGATGCRGVRPGAFVETPSGFCTLNFLFTGSDRNRYIGTAGHCVLGDGPFAADAGEKVWRYPKGPRVKDGSGKVIGYVVYAVLKAPKDFALIRLLPRVRASASMCHFGGPRSAASPTGSLRVLHYYGNGIGVGDVLPARTAIARSFASRDHVYANGVVVPGDSGGGVIDDLGRAVGVIVTTGLHADRISDPGTIGITRLQPQLARAAKLLRLRLTLRTAPLA